MVPNTITTFECGRGTPARVKMPLVHCVPHVESATCEHLVEWAQSHILIGVKENHQTISGLLPG
jgi:hypothetical protein